MLLTAGAAQPEGLAGILMSMLPIILLIVVSIL